MEGNEVAQRAAYEKADTIARIEVDKIMAVVAAMGEREPLVANLMLAWLLQAAVQTLYWMAEDKEVARGPEGIPGQVNAILQLAFKEWPERKQVAQDLKEQGHKKLITLN